MSDRSSDIGNIRCLTRVMEHLESHAWENWINSYTVWGHCEEGRICEWAYDLVQHITADLERNGFVFAYNTHKMTRRVLYWCWAIKKTAGNQTMTVFDSPFPQPCADNSNDPYEMDIFNYTIGSRYWRDIVQYWRPDWMTEDIESHFFALLELFCWRHVNTECSRTISKERALLEGEEGNDSNDETRGTEQGSYFKGKKEMY
jgi:hypothetical protein